MKKIILSYTLFFLIFCGKASYASKVLASSFGYNTTDVTTAFGSAITSNVDTVVIDFVGNGEWVITSSIFFNVANKVIIFEPNVKLIAKPGAFIADVPLLKFTLGQNIKISGYGATFQMQKVEYTTGEFRHTLHLENSNGIVVEGLILKDSGGDGIYIGGENTLSASPYCENVIVKDCIMDNNRRQGMSVISAKNLLVSNCLFKNTNGTLPEAGLDVEPYETYQRIENCKFSKCRFTNNNGHGIELAFFYMDNTSAPVSVTFEDCYVSQNHAITNTYQATEIYANAKCESPVSGVVTFNNCLVENSQWSAFACRNPSNKVQINFNNSIFKNVSQAAILYNNPIWLEICDYNLPAQGFGGVNFNNVLIDYSSNMAVIGTYGQPAPAAGLQNITGNLIVKNPTYNIPTSYNNINSFVNVSYTNTYYSAIPAQNITVTNANTSTFFEQNCNKAFINITRATNSNIPLAVKYNTTGTATDRNDYCQMPLFKIINPNETNAVDTILFRNDNTVEPIETVGYNIVNTSDYTATPTVASVTIQDGACTLVPVKEFLLTRLLANSNNTISIYWQTKEEINNDYFTIEKSFDGLNFIKVATQKAKENTLSLTNYTFKDETSNGSSVIYYRIKQTDFVGNFSYSNILKITIKQDAVTINPNPAKNFINVNTIKKIKAFSIKNNTGISYIKKDFTNSYINVSMLPSGFYTLQLQEDNGNVIAVKFLKL